MWSLAWWNNQCWYYVSESRQREVNFWGFLKPFTLQQTHSCTSVNSHVTTTYMQHMIITKKLSASFMQSTDKIHYLLSIRYHPNCTKYSATLQILLHWQQRPHTWSKMSVSMLKHNYVATAGKCECRLNVSLENLVSFLQVWGICNT